MKKSLLLAVVLLAFNSLFANPVDANLAKELGQKFVSANFVQKSNVLELVYTETSESGEPCFYIFNVSNNGFIIISADDVTRPILGYSENGVFDVDNIVPGVGFMMDIYKESISYAKENNIAATMNIASEWKSLEATGKTTPAMRGQSVEPLCTTKWNQSWPYNKYCPEQSASWASHGHVVVGCVATAMAQVMAYWDHPTQGTGSHTYNAPMYGQQTVNFGETTYDWENMVDVIDASSPVEQIDAIAILSYHCGVAVDMGYDTNGDGSGAHSIHVPAAIQSYFGYAPSQVTNFTNYAAWMVSLKNAIDMRRPVYYSGCSETGCHAFVCDGYDENQLYHFNYGWGGSGDGYFAPNAIEYSVSQVQSIFNFMPKSVYENAAQAPTDLNVVPAADNELKATLTWTNPSKALNQQALTNIDKIVVERSGKVVAELTGTNPGETVTFVDENVPCFSTFTYSVYAIVNGAYGDIANVSNVQFGPTCIWKLMIQSDQFQGMRGASISLRDAAGVEFMKETSTNSSLKTIEIPMPLGDVQFSWIPQTYGDPFLMTILVKDSNNETVYSNTATSTEIEAGVFLTVTNTCGSEVEAPAPTNLSAEANGDNLVLTWECAETPFYGYNIFRDGLLIALSKETTFVDDDMPYGGHCYTVTALSENGNTEHSNEVCSVLTENCEPAYDLWYEYTSAGKIKIYWEAPVNSEGLGGYYVMRKTSDENEWKRVKILGANKNDYTDNGANDDAIFYSYQVIAYYQEIDCMSAPAKAKYTDKYSVTVSTPTSADELQSQPLRVYPNPTDDNLMIEAEGIKNISIFNLTGQMVYEASVNSDEVVVNVSDFESGIYLIQIETSEYKVTKRISVAH